MTERTIDNTTIKCLCCKVILKPLDKHSNQMWHDGTVSEIAIGYGSSYDGDIYSFGLCDTCISKLIEDGSLLYVRNYMGLK